MNIFSDHGQILSTARNLAEWLRGLASISSGPGLIGFFVRIFTTG